MIYCTAKMRGDSEKILKNYLFLTKNQEITVKMCIPFSNR